MGDPTPPQEHVSDHGPPGLPREAGPSPASCDGELMHARVTGLQAYVQRLQGEIALRAQQEQRLRDELGRAERLTRSLRAELKELSEGMRFQIGDVLVRAWPPSLRTLAVPFELARLFVRGLRRRSKRTQSGRAQAAQRLDEASGLAGVARPVRGVGLPSETGSDLVSVVMTTFNSRDTLRRAIESILNQTHRNLELIVVDDDSRDGTFVLLEEAAARDSRVRPVKSFRNEGTYCAKNLGLTLARGAVVTFQDSDDWSAPDRLTRQFAALLASPWAAASICDYVRRDADGQIVLNRGERQRRALISLMFRREVVLGRVGYFDSVRTSADDEFLQRLALVFGAESVVHVPAVLYEAALRDGSLTTSGPAPTDMSRGQQRVEEFLSPARRAYVDAYRSWHQQIADRQAEPYLPYPLIRRRFPAPESILPTPGRRDEPVVASLASIPSRQQCLAGVVAALRSQVDQLNVYLNNYPDVPDFLCHERIRVARSQEHGDRRDNGKFFFLSDHRDGYYLTVDDDIHYPPDYVSRLLLKIDQYERRAIVGVHGVLLADPLVRFFQGRSVTRFQEAAGCDRFVHLLGTGTVAFHRDTLPLDLADFGEPGMADLWLAVAARRRRVPMVCIARPAGWLFPMESEGDNLFDEFARRDEVQTRVASENGPWSEGAMRPIWGPLADDLGSRFTPGELRSRDIDLPMVSALRPAP